MLVPVFSEVTTENILNTFPCTKSPQPTSSDVLFIPRTLYDVLIIDFVLNSAANDDQDTINDIKAIEQKFRDFERNTENIPNASTLFEGLMALNVQNTTLKVIQHFHQYIREYLSEFDGNFETALIATVANMYDGNRNNLINDLLNSSIFWEETKDFDKSKYQEKCIEVLNRLGIDANSRGVRRLLKARYPSSSLEFFKETISVDFPVLYDDDNRSQGYSESPYQNIVNWFTPYARLDRHIDLLVKTLRLELQYSNHLVLYRAGISNTFLNTTTDRSESMNMSLFSGALLDCMTACTLYIYLDRRRENPKLELFWLDVDPQDRFFIIPPLHPLLQLFGSGEYWHPRTKWYRTKRDITGFDGKEIQTSNELQLTAPLPEGEASKYRNALHHFGGKGTVAKLAKATYLNMKYKWCKLSPSL